MRKVLLILMSVLLLAGITIAGCAAPTEEVAPTEEAAPQEGVIECIWSSGGPSYPEAGEGFGINPYIHYLQACTELNPAFKGRFEFKIYESGILYNQNDAQTALASGAIQMTYGGCQYFEQFQPEWKLLSAPGVIDNYEHFRRVMETEPFKELTQGLAASKGTTILKWIGGLGPVYIYTMKPCENIADIDGLKIRYFGGEGVGKALASLGAIPIFMPYTEVVTALQTNQIDGMITDLSGALFFFELPRYCPNILPYELFEEKNAITANTEWLQSLPSSGDIASPDIYEYLQGPTSIFNRIETYPFFYKFNGMLLDLWKQSGCYVAPYDEAQAKTLRETVIKAQEELIGGINPKYMKAIESVR